MLKTWWEKGFGTVAQISLLVVSEDETMPVY